VAASVAAHIPADRILAAYPSLDANRIELVALYAHADPARGRPRPGNDLPMGAVIMTDRRVPRGMMAR
jgi:hypothetical protein